MARLELDSVFFSGTPAPTVQHRPEICAVPVGAGLPAIGLQGSPETAATCVTSPHPAIFTYTPPYNTHHDS
ncbi:protein of unknown function [Pseudomonas sp. JV551A1]|uniref:Uncharacterized protein n=1 Tax=Pseudomonas inefficax TaxID=2078786 RepID=A0AAQ1PCA5_9PSED|nr:protein of unknown function [Pseudomonas sp. JV551A1]SPO63826.1 protein of unknown function [Pseudomonas inefficax]